VFFIGTISVFSQVLVSCYKYLTTARLRILIASLQSVAVILLAAFLIKKRRRGHSDPIYPCSELDPADETVPASLSNPTDDNEYRPSNQTEDHEKLIMMDTLGKHTLSLTNESDHTSSET